MVSISPSMLPMPSSQTTKWLDLSAHGAKLRLFQLTDRTVNLVLSGVDPNSEEGRAVQVLGFAPSRSGRALIRAGTDVQTKALREIFPRYQIRDTPISSIWLRVKGQVSDTQQQVQERAVIGRNRWGYPVRLDSDGSRYVTAEDGRLTYERDRIVPIAENKEIPAELAAYFLRAPSPQALALCADGFVGEMLAGRHMDSGDVRHFASVIYGESRVLAVADKRLRIVQEAIEAAMQRCLFTRHHAADEEAFKLAVTLDEHQPTFSFRTSTSIQNQQYSTALPIAIAMQHILGDTTGTNVLEPTIGNGSLVTALPRETKVTGVEIDAVRVAQVRALREGMHLITGDILNVASTLDHNFDFVIANPPFGGLPAPTPCEDLLCYRIDHLITLKALKQRADNGRAIFLIGADYENLIEQGKIVGSSQKFFAWLADHYDIEEAIELDGALYRKQGAAYPVRMVTVGRRRSPQEAHEALKSKAFRLDERLPVIHTWEALWENTTALVKRLTPISLPIAFSKSDNEAPSQLSALTSTVQPLSRLTERKAALVKNSEASQSVIQPISAAVNDYQTLYLPASTLNEPTAMIPRNLDAPVRCALARLVEEIGTDVDSYVAEKLQLSVEEMELAFSAEQVDAIALAIKRMEEGRGFINGDQTGQGKGRVLAALARYAVLNQQVVIFLTEKANLFSDFWRDLKDIDSHQLFTPLILNNGESIRHMDTYKVEIPATKPGVIKTLIDDDATLIDSGYNLMFATYSQFNRAGSASKKANWLPAAANRAVLLIDESHVAAGESNISDNVGLAVDAASACIYSSATFAKNAKNMRAYAKVFPKSVGIESIAYTLAAGGEPLQEILSAMLAEEGVFIRREHDLSQLEFETVAAEETQARDEQWADALSEALRAMSYFSGDVTRVMECKNKEIQARLESLPEPMRKGSRMGVSYTNFGSRLYTILRQFSLAIKIDKVAEQAVKSLQVGRKPVIVLEQTFESLLREVILENQRFEKEEREIDERALQKMGLSPHGLSVDTLTFRDVMNRIANKLQWLYVRDDYGHGRHENVCNLAQNSKEAIAIQATIAHISTKIAKLPDIPISPLDTLRQKITEAGFTCGEISGRLFQTQPDAQDASKIVVGLRTDRRLQTLSDFNNGRLDAIILTRAGATGLSLHASAKFADQRQRELIEAQIANNVAERVQFFGRVNRRNQVNVPCITSIMTLLPSEKRVLAMQNAKLRKLSANTQSNRNNQAEIRDVPDILNPTGDAVCRLYLEENPEVAALLDINPAAEVDSNQEAYFANKLTGRIALLPIAKQKEAYDELTRVFEETVEELKSKGINPFQTSVKDWGAKIVEQQIFRAGNKESGSVFDLPVYLARIEWEQEVKPYSSEKVLRSIEEGRRFLVETDHRFRLIERPESRNQHEKWEINCIDMCKDIDEHFTKAKQRTLEALSNFNSIEEAIASKEFNPIKQLANRQAWLKGHLWKFMPGSIIHFTGKEDVGEEGMIISFIPPPERERTHYLGQYKIHVVVPGSEKAQNFTLNQLISDPLFAYAYSFGNDIKDPLKAFDATKAGKVKSTRYALMGNLFAASQLAVEQNLGTTGIFTDDVGARHRAVILYQRVTLDEVVRMPIALNRQHISTLLQKAFMQGESARLFASSSLDKKACQIIFDKNRPASFAIQTSGSSLQGGIIFSNPELLKVTGDFVGNRTCMSATVDIEQMEAVVDILVNHCYQSFYVDAASAKKFLPELIGEENKAKGDEDEPPESRSRGPRFAA